jgi:ABC-type transport system involved in Fe-S cluster assembly fused permease/ATPase subunit
MATNQETGVGILCDPNLYRKLHLSSLGPQIIIVFHVLIFGRCEMSISVDKICIICAFEINKWFIIIIIIIYFLFSFVLFYLLSRHAEDGRLQGNARKQAPCEEKWNWKQKIKKNRV